MLEQPKMCDAIKRDKIVSQAAESFLHHTLNGPVQACSSYVDAEQLCLCLLENYKYLAMR